MILIAIGPSGPVGPDPDVERVEMRRRDYRYNDILPNDTQR